MESLTDRIEEEVEIAASAEEVWKIVSVAGFWVNRVVADSPAQSSAVGDQVVVGNQDFGNFDVQVLELQPPTRAVYRWKSADSFTWITVVFTLEQTAQSTQLRVTESGFENFNASDREQHLADNQDGWTAVTAAIKAQCEPSRLGELSRGELRRLDELSRQDPPRP